MSAPHGELIGWILSLTLLTGVLAVLLLQIRRRPTTGDAIPWREIVAITIGFVILILAAFIFPFAGRLFFTDHGLPSLLNR